MPYSYEPHHYGDLDVGQTFESAGRTVTETEFSLHSMLTGDWTELHTNREYSEQGPYGQRIAHGPMTFVLATGLFQRTGVVERTVIAFLGMNYMDVPNPLFIGDTISAEYEITEKRELESRDDAGFVCVDATVTKQDGTTVFAGDMKFLWKYESTDADDE